MIEDTAKIQRKIQLEAEKPHQNTTTTTLEPKELALQTDAVGLPAGWAWMWDEETEQSYYVDHNTRTTHWDRPITDAAPEAATEAAAETIGQEKKQKKKKKKGTSQQVIALYSTPMSILIFVAGHTKQ